MLCHNHIQTPRTSQDQTMVSLQPTRSRTYPPRIREPKSERRLTGSINQLYGMSRSQSTKYRPTTSPVLPCPTTRTLGKAHLVALYSNSNCDLVCRERGTISENLSGRPHPHRSLHNFSSMADRDHSASRTKPPPFPGLIPR